MKLVVYDEDGLISSAAISATPIGFCLVINAWERGAWMHYCGSHPAASTEYPEHAAFNVGIYSDDNVLESETESHILLVPESAEEKAALDNSVKYLLREKDQGVFQMIDREHLVDHKNLDQWVSPKFQSKGARP